MATVTKPIALDESLNTTELSSRNVADVLAQELSAVATAIGGISAPSAEDVSYDNSGSGLSATDVQNAIDELSSEKADSSSLATVATSGDYDDLINKPTIPTVNDATLTIQKNGSDVATFTANASSNVTANITVPTTTSELTNNSDFVSDASYVHTDNNFTTAEKTKLSGIESGAEVNVQSDWNEADNTKDDYIKNKPSSEVKSATDTFTTVNGGLLEECVIKLEPVQDLHGYPEPWVGGAGKNSFVSATAKTEEQNGVKIWTDGDGIYHINGMASATTNILFPLKQGFTIPSSSTHHFYLGNDFNNVSITLSLMNGSTQVDNWNCSPQSRDSDAYSSMANKYIDGVRVVVQSGVSVSNVSIAPMLLLDTETDTSYAPWDNICPINGHTEVDLQRDGKNLLNPSEKVIDSVYQLHFYKTNNYLFRSGFTYTIEYKGGDGDVRLYFAKPASEGGVYAMVTGTIASFTPEEDCYGFIQFTRTAEMGTLPNNTEYFLMHIGNGSQPYEPYLGHLYQVQIGSTVYGGTDDIVNGKIKNKTRKIVVSSSTPCDNFISSSNGSSARIAINGIVNSNNLCDKCSFISYDDRISPTYLNKNRVYIDPNGWLIIRASATETVLTISELLTLFDGYEIVYYCSDEQIVNHAPQQIEALVGQNNLSAPLDGQSIDSVKYREVFAFDDVEKVVSLRVPISMLGTDESGRTTASQSYASGDYFYKDGYMCKALTSISAGATLTLNTNYSQGTLADILKAIENA